MPYPPLMSEPQDEPGDEVRPGETESERADRNFNDILQELRVTQTGVQILFGFLLTMPLQARFDRLDDYLKNIDAREAAGISSAGDRREDGTKE